MKKFPYLTVAGSHRDLGLAIGETFREKIRKKIWWRKRIIFDYDIYLQKTRPYYSAAQKTYPQFITELEAIAEAAGISVADVFFINNREVYDISEHWDRQGRINPDHCTIAVSFGDNGPIVGHNEDWSPETINELYILKATIGETIFLGLQYATALPGVSATMNNWGLVQCINDVYATNQIGVPKNFLARAVLECKTLDEAESLIRNTKRASGFNHVLVQTHEIRNIEIAGKHMVVEQVINAPYVHTNHFLSPTLKQYEKFHTRSSEQRYQRAKQLLKPSMSLVDMRALLSDTQDSQYPICRPNETIGSVILLPQNRKVYICYGHPCQGKYAEYRL